MGSDSTLSPGELVDRYEIRELIGEGGMGAIYRAVDTRLGRSVALKIVRRDLSEIIGEPARKRFLREALAMSKVEHRNVVRVIDFGFWRDTPYLAMELLRGQDLGKLVQASSGFLPIAEVVDVMLGVCAAIRACHDAGVIHRDLKPSNIFLCEGDGGREVRILDFGISKLPTTGTTTDLTQDGEIVGTPQFLAPEQIAGKSLPQTDQYAIGVVLYQCLTKALPHQRHANVMSVLRAIELGEVTPPRALRADLPEKLEAVVLRAMRSVPMERFESVYALGRALWEFASPLERDRWRSYYFDDRPAAAPANDSKFGMPLVEAWARGIAPTPQSGSGSRGARGGRTPGAPTPPAGDKTSLYPDFLRPDRTPPVDESVPELKTPRSTRARWLTASVVVSAALAAALAGARWWTTRGSVAEVSPQPVAPLSSAPVPTRPPPPRPEPPLDPRPADPVRVAGPPVHPPSTDSATKLTAPNRPKKPGHRNVGKKNADHAPDGLPILP